MDKCKINYFVDALLLLAGLISGVTGVMKLDLLIPLNLFQYLDYKLFSFVHDWSGVIFVVLILVHVIMHFDWFFSMTKSILLETKLKLRK